MIKKIKRPIVANWIRFEQIGEDEFLVRDLLFDEEDDEPIILESEIVWFAKQLDGKTDPHVFDDELSRGTVNLYLHILDAAGVIRDKIFFSKRIFDLMITLWQPKVTTKVRMVSLLLNTLLMISFLPVFLLSVNQLILNIGNIGFDYWIGGFIFGIVSGTFLHEMGHLWACLGYGGQAFEVGLLFMFFLPGAYVLIKDDRIKKRMRRVQVSAAGVEMNILLAGILILFASKNSSLSGFFLGAAIQNLLMALTNMTFVNGFNRMVKIGELMGDKALYFKAKNVLKNHEYRKHLEKQGLKGQAIIVVSYILGVLQLTLPLLYLLNIGAVVICFI